MVTFRIGNYELLVGSIADGATYRNLAIHTSHSIPVGDQAIDFQDTVDLVLALGVLVHGHLAHGSVGFEDEAARISDVADGNLTVMDKAHQKGGSVLEAVLRGDVQEVLVELVAHYRNIWVRDIVPSLNPNKNGTLIKGSFCS